MSDDGDVVRVDPTSPRPGTSPGWRAAAWMVRSATTTGAWWLVTWGYERREGIWFSCSCPAGRERGRMSPAPKMAKMCRHVRAVVAWEQETDRAAHPKPPPPPTNPAAFLT